MVPGGWNVTFPAESRPIDWVDAGGAAGRVSDQLDAIPEAGAIVTVLELAVEFPIDTGPKDILAGVFVAPWNVKVPPANAALAVPEGRPVIVPADPVTLPP
jgi:hypothetical protein